MIKMAIFETMVSFALTLTVIKAEMFTVDLSYEYIENYTYFAWPKSYLKRTANPLNGQHDQYWLADYDFFMGEHGGTHLDAPHHFCKDCKTIEQIPLSDLLNLPLCVVDVSHKTKGPENRDYELTIADLKEWEKRYGRIPEGGVVFVNFGWAQHYPERKEFLGSDQMKLDGIAWHFPGFGIDVANWMANERNIKGLGTDAASFDVGAASDTFPVHTAWLSKDKWGIEVLANLDKAPASGAMVSVLPTKFKGGSGAPARVYAVWSTDGAATPQHFITLLAMSLGLAVWMNP